VNTVSDKVVQPFTGLSIRTRMVHGCGWSSSPSKFGQNWPTASKTPISNQYSVVAKESPGGLMFHYYSWRWNIWGPGGGFPLV